ncbi:hypothetical protein [Notoacmeibacter sp. MSK16QG-6]|uniref:hypothetical protein n=1 Tax=Notoacmeibacter sp. MSK16QG-6 TaxID=2957982 RepID=UPI0020A1632D|nr:hypothetical protein [Notoacmeibacter sp. MSK16QG-6]MCP1198742.1 hypothetical protein [Notoacmeibacter sp. MSK16QG-6]
MSDLLAFMGVIYAVATFLYPELPAEIKGSLRRDVYVAISKTCYSEGAFVDASPLDFGNGLAITDYIAIENKIAATDRSGVKSYSRPDYDSKYFIVARGSAFRIASIAEYRCSNGKSSLFAKGKYLN